MSCYIGCRAEEKGGWDKWQLSWISAYDRVEWGFLCQIMLKLGFAPRWVHLAMKTLTTASYSVLINRES